jgi:Condensation domain
VIVARYPLSYGQQGMWFVQQLDDATGVYHDREMFRLTGRLDVPSFRKAVEHLVSRHEVLRTRFVTLGGEPVQVVDDRWCGEVRVQRPRDGLMREAQVDAFIREVLERPLDLGRGPLFLVDLLRLDDDDHLLALSMHHIVMDGWSVRIMLEQVSRSYAELIADRAPTPAPTLQYGNFALWQRSELQGAYREKLLNYWVDHLAGARTELYSSGGRSTGTVEFDVPADIAERLIAFARSCGVTLFTALLGVFELVMARVAGVQDLLVGVPVVGRTAPEFEESVGLFVNLLPLRADLRDDPTGAELLRRARSAVLGGFAHQDLPFDQLVAEVNPVRLADVHPLVQVTLQLIDASFDTALRLDGVRVVSVPADEPEIAYALSLDLRRTADGLRGRLVHATAAVDAERAREVAELFVRVASRLPSSGQSPVSLLTATSETV